MCTVWNKKWQKVLLFKKFCGLFFSIWTIKRNNSKLYQILIHNYIVYLAHTSFILFMEIPVKQLVVNKYLKYLHYRYLIHI